MAKLVWDNPGEHLYQVGVDRGVLYLHDGTVAVWNGLTAVEESSDTELKSFYLEGIKYLQNLAPGDYSAKLKAYTYPDEFNSVNGIAAFAPGLIFFNQPSQSFNLSYQTRIGDDVQGQERGYKIHLLYNVLANPDAASFISLTDSVATPVEFSWTLTGVPSATERIEKFRPTVHIAIDSTKTPPDIMTAVLAKLYGTETSNPSFPSIYEISEFFGYLGALIIVDYGDGTWSAIDESDTYITMINDTEFQIDHADTTYLDTVTYTVSSTNVGQEN